jgi:hypothetical protein
LKLGVSYIYLYDNHPEPNKHLPYHHPQIRVFHCPQPYIQLLAYHHCYTKAIYETDGVPPPTWLGMIDIDEFLVIKESGVMPLGERLEQWAANGGFNTGALVFHWAIFGSNGLQGVRDGDYSVLKRFTRRGRELNEHVKSFVRPDAISRVLSPHHCELLPPWVSRDVLGRLVDSACDTDPTRQASQSIAYINHYFTKSREEFNRKCERGRADLPQKRNADIEFPANDLNDIEDITALVFYES